MNVKSTQMKCIIGAQMKKLIISLTFVTLVISSLSACRSTVGGEEPSTESWQIGEHWMYSPQAIWGDQLVVHEVLFGDVRVAEQYISLYDADLIFLKKSILSQSNL